MPLTGLLGVRPASAVPVWTPATVIGPNGGHLSQASNAAGDTVAVWMGQAGISASFRSADGSWGAPRHVSHQAVFADIQGLALDVVLDDADRATVLWTVYDYGCNGCYGPPSSTWSAHGSAAEGWASPVLLNQGNDATADLAIDAHGTVSAVWDYSVDCGYGAEGRPLPCPDGVQTRLSFSSRPIEGSWSAPSDIASGPAGGGARPALAAAPDGTLSLLAITGRIGPGHLIGFTKAPGQLWGPPQTLDASDIDPSAELLVASDAAGAVLAGVTACGTYSTQTSCRAETFSKPASSTTWSSPDVRESLPATSFETLAALAVDGAGVATFAWLLPSANPTLSTAQRVGGRWETPSTLRTGTNVNSLAVAVNATGAAVAAWSHGSTGSQSVASAYRASTGPWQRPVVVSGSSPAPADGLVSVASSGAQRFTIGYEKTEGRRGASYSDRVDDRSAPTARMTGPSARLATAVFRVSWASVDRPAGVATVDVRRRTATWRKPFGRWSTWKSHVPASSAVFRGAPGRTYCFSVRPTDRAGHTGRWSRQRCTGTPVDDRSARTSSGWIRTTSAGAFRGTLTSTSRYRAQLMLSGATGRRYFLVAATCRGCGTVQVSFGGHVVRRVSLRSTLAQQRRVFALASYRTSHSGRLVVTVTSHHRPVRIDGVIISR